MHNTARFVRVWLWYTSYGHSSVATVLPTICHFQEGLLVGPNNAIASLLAASLTVSCTNTKGTQTGSKK
jgi:hypothetical protein